MVDPPRVLHNVARCLTATCRSSAAATRKTRRAARLTATLTASRKTAGHLLLEVDRVAFTKRVAKDTRGHAVLPAAATHRGCAAKLLTHIAATRATGSTTGTTTACGTNSASADCERHNAQWRAIGLHNLKT